MVPYIDIVCKNGRSFKFIPPEYLYLAALKAGIDGKKTAMPIAKKKRANPVPDLGVLNVAQGHYGIVTPDSGYSSMITDNLNNCIGLGIFDPYSGKSFLVYIDERTPVKALFEEVILKEFCTSPVAGDLHIGLSGGWRHKSGNRLRRIYNGLCDVVKKREIRISHLRLFQTSPGWPVEMSMNCSTGIVNSWPESPTTRRKKYNTDFTHSVYNLC